MKPHGLVASFRPSAAGSESPSDWLRAQFLAWRISACCFVTHPGPPFEKGGSLATYQRTKRHSSTTTNASFRPSAAGSESASDWLRAQFLAWRISTCCFMTHPGPPFEKGGSSTTNQQIARHSLPTAKASFIAND
ncbi:hypothetical protein [Sunxiuqinia dokdonensis]|uniref:hypothetical protein n=1 Tax=Sunxiuqinia dokdonensis TaxID=1409788 RepID=UPI0012F7B634|nr:hypothetical protein [Sunxiuqinia dokdonensis]